MAPDTAPGKILLFVACLGNNGDDASERDVDSGDVTTTVKPV